jgi:hypothetical protein
MPPSKGEYFTINQGVDHMSENVQDRVCAFDIISRTFKTISATPALAIPFFFVGVFNFIWLFAVYFAPRYPVSIIMAPPIKKIWGGEFLTYPKNFVLIPKLYHYGELAIVFTLGLCATAYALWMLKCVYEDQKTFSSLRGVLKAITNYLKMAIVFVVLYYVIKGVAMLIFPILQPLFKINPHFVLLTVPVEILLIAVIQALFFFVFPGFIIGEKKFFKAIVQNFQLFSNNAGAVFILILLPSLLFLPGKALFIYNPIFAQRIGYESICYIIAINIAVNIVADICISLFSGVAYIEASKTLTADQATENRGEQNG